MNVDIFNPDFVGRPEPIKHKEGTHVPDRSHLANDESPFHGIYPANLKTDEDKYKHLQALRDEDEISVDIFFDLVDVLKVKDKPIRLEFV